MSGLWLLVAALGLLVLPAFGRPIGRKVAPRDWARLSAASLAAGVIGVVLALLLLAAPTIFRAAGVPALAAACKQMAGTLSPGGATVGWISATAAVVLSAAFATALVRIRRIQLDAHVEPWLGHHYQRAHYEVVVLACAELVAMSVPRPPQVVVSEGLVAALPHEQLEAVLDHEAAHLIHRHSRYLALIAGLRSALGRVPVMGRSAESLRLALEQWADDDASRHAPGGRETVRAALLNVAEAAVAAVPIATFSPAETIAERLDALQSPPPRQPILPRAVQAPALALGIVGALSVAAWVSQAHMMLAMAGVCRL